MGKLSRRGLLKLTCGAAAGAAGGLLPFIARGDGVWGDLPPNILTPSENFGVLHIHLLGGMAPYESFYFRDEAGVRTRGFDQDVEDLLWNSGCGDTPDDLEISPSVLGFDEKNKPVHLGPFAKPLWLRSDIYNRTRVVVQSHDLAPHEPALAYNLTGLRLGNPNQASLGAAIARRYLALDAALGAPPRTTPYAYGLIDGSNSVLLAECVAMMGAIGRHPSPARPLVLKVGGGLTTLINQLSRNNMSSAKDLLLDQYRSQYRDWLRKSGEVTRSSAFRDYDTTLTTLLNAAPLHSLLSSMPASSVNKAECARVSADSFDTNSNRTQTALQAATFLLTRPAETRARYVCVVDRGLENRGGAGYDVHAPNPANPVQLPAQVADTGTNLWNTLTNLTALINDPAAGSPDPNKLNLADTLIVITTEFGRTPFRSYQNNPNQGACGRDHWPQGYVNVLIGGPITTRGVVGSLSDDDEFGAVADATYSATDLHAAVLLAAGIDPFESANLNLSQITAAIGDSAEEARENLKTVVLGL